MKMIVEEATLLADDKPNIILSTGKLALGFVASEELGFHVSEAIEVAGTKRKAHAISISFRICNIAAELQFPNLRRLNYFTRWQACG